MRTNSDSEHYHLQTTMVTASSLITLRTVDDRKPLRQLQILVQTFDTTFERVFRDQHRDLDLRG